MSPSMMTQSNLLDQLTELRAPTTVWDSSLLRHDR
jgi:hypothetical protein